MITYLPCGSGKTQNLKIIAQSLAEKDPTLKIVLALPNNFLLSRMQEQYKAANINTKHVSKLFAITAKDSQKKQRCEEHQFSCGITLSTHEVVATLAYYTPGFASDLVLLVDEVDMLSPAKDMGFKGAEHLIKAKFFCGCTATKLTDEDRKELQFPPGSVFNELRTPNATIHKELAVIND